MTDDLVTDPLAALLTDPAASTVLALLGAGGHGAWIVGGAVRDVLLGRSPGDIDMATDAEPLRVVALAQAAGLKAVPTGIDHGTVTLVVEGRPVEVTTLRRDVETDGRHAVVAFGTSLPEDAARRDFTMNALYLSADAVLLDPVDGLGDLRARHVRFIGDPLRRIAEDHLRSLRYFRMHAWHGDPEGGLDADALDAVARSLDGLDGLSRERVGAEMLRLLAAPDPAPALAGLRATGALARILPGAEPAAIAPLVHFEAEASLAPDPVRRLAALGGEDPTTALRLSRAQARRLEILREAIGTATGPAELGYRLGAEEAIGVLALRAASLGHPLDPEAVTLARGGAGRALPVTASDLAPLAGPDLGARLKAIERTWIDSGFTATRDALLGSP